MERKVWGYDFEVFTKTPSKWWCVTFIEDNNRDNIVTIVNDTKAFREFWMQHQDDIFVGYNSTHYDAIVAKGLLNNMCPSFVTEQIIEKGKTEYQILKNK